MFNSSSGFAIYGYWHNCASNHSGLEPWCPPGSLPILPSAQPICLSVFPAPCANLNHVLSCHFLSGKWHYSPLQSILCICARLIFLNCSFDLPFCFKISCAQFLFASWIKSRVFTLDSPAAHSMISTRHSNCILHFPHHRQIGCFLFSAYTLCFLSSVLSGSHAFATATHHPCCTLAQTLSPTSK